MVKRHVGQKILRPKKTQYSPVAGAQARFSAAAPMASSEQTTRIRESVRASPAKYSWTHFSFGALSQTHSSHH